jgi:Flp pilus assembly protein TadG
MFFSRFCRDRRGSVLPLFSVAIIPVMSLVGAAVDYSRANALKAKMQSALDSTALMVSKSASTSTAEALQTNAKNYFLALLGNTPAENVQVTALYSNAGNGSGGANATLKVSASIKTVFMSVIGIPQVTVSASSTSKWGQIRLRVALALDNTGSMDSSGKMPALKTATHSLLNMLQGVATQPGDVYVSLIPFSKDVNVGPANYDKSWVNFSEWEDENGTCSDNSYHTRSKCVSKNKIWTPANRNTWNGCVTDRDQNYDTRNTAPTTTNTATLFPAEQYSSCPVPLLPLTDVWADLHARVDQMTPVGNTNQTIGLQWAWQSLTSTEPLNAPPKDPNFQYQDVIILMSDGLNTENRWSTSQTSVDSRMDKACDRAKAAGVMIYTVLVMSGNSTLLKDCATDQTKYFAVNSTTGLVATFETIGAFLTKLHLSK